MKRVLCVWFPGWPLQRLYVAQPELRTRPLVLYRQGQRGATVVLCSHQAQQRGLRPGMPVAEAASLAAVEGDRGRKCRQRPLPAVDSTSALHWELYEPATDWSALQELAAWCERYSPVVGIEESALLPDDSPDTLLADVTGCAHLLGGEELLAEQVHGELAARGYTTRLAIADTIGAAWGVAHFHSGLPTVLQKPITIMPTGGGRAALQHLPVEALRLPIETVDLLRELGLETMGQLMALQRAALPARFGKEILRRLDEALGQQTEVVQGHRARPPLEVDWCFESPVDQHGAVEGALGRMLEQLMATLEERGEGVEQLEYRLYLTSGEWLPLQVGTVRPRSSARYLLDLMRLQLEQVRLSAPVAAIRLQATLTASQLCEQRPMFAGAEFQMQRQLSELLDRLTGRLGRTAVVRCRLAGDSQPERGYRHESVVGARPGKRSAVPRKRVTDRRASAAERGPREVHLLSRPLTLLEHPLSAEVWSVVPNGPLARFSCSLANEQIARSWGPERIETGWWRGAVVRRDYYQVEAHSGRRYWLFCRLQDRRWFVHGLFE